MSRRLGAIGLIALAVGAFALPRGAAPAPHPPSFSGSSIRSFWVNQSAPGAVTEVTDPAGGGERVFKLTVGDRDETNPGAPNPRAALISPQEIRPGVEFWWSSKFLLPRGFPARLPGWLNLMQGPFGKPWNGSPPWFVKVEGKRIEWQRNDTYHWDVPWEMPLTRGRWVEVLVHTRFGEHGFVEMWIDGRPVTFFRDTGWNPNHHPPTRRLRMRTRDRSNDGGPNSIYLQSYRKRGMFDSLTVYEGPLRIGPTRASVRP